MHLTIMIIMMTSMTIITITTMISMTIIIMISIIIHTISKIISPTNRRHMIFLLVVIHRCHRNLQLMAKTLRRMAIRRLQCRPHIVELENIDDDDKQQDHNTSSNLFTHINCIQILIFFHILICFQFEIDVVFFFQFHRYWRIGFPIFRR